MKIETGITGRSVYYTLIGESTCLLINFLWRSWTNWTCLPRHQSEGPFLFNKLSFLDGTRGGSWVLWSSSVFPTGWHNLRNDLNMIFWCPEFDLQTCCCAFLRGVKKNRLCNTSRKQEQTLSTSPAAPHFLLRSHRRALGVNRLVDWGRCDEGDEGRQNKMKKKKKKIRGKPEGKKKKKKSPPQTAKFPTISIHGAFFPVYREGRMRKKKKTHSSGHSPLRFEMCIHMRKKYWCIYIFSRWTLRGLLVSVAIPGIFSLFPSFFFFFFFYTTRKPKTFFFLSKDKGKVKTRHTREHLHKKNKKVASLFFFFFF